MDFLKHLESWRILIDLKKNVFLQFYSPNIVRFNGMFHWKIAW